ncbi:hypothetical protein GTR04_1335 [Trichophyton interdigitale]|uniref:Uncharacterized protein n=1 Tax=Trichophyton interdigitale TaxID=101480 RepID=A0A9P4YM32_9EURO|nr:hypothetical protein GY631_1037 [Trichophyton interdigitale]KAF3900306.1 hypothetical protein GY632_0850 [Trichophyton interdigitale]KAG8211287.1 hypothetical protein GTR04_1335 [Trichophyton interdigitale]
MDPDFVHRQFPTSYLRTKLGSERQQQQQQQQQQLTAWQTVDGRPSLTPGLPRTPSASSAEREGYSPKPADDSQTLCSSAPPPTLSPSEIERRGQQIITQILQTPVSQEEADFLRSLPLYTPPRSSSGGQDFTLLFPPAPAEGQTEGQAGREEGEEELPAIEAISTKSPLNDTRQPPLTSPVSRSVSPNTLTLKPLQFNTATNSWPLPPIESVTRSFWDPIRDAFREQVQVEKMEDTENWLRGLPSIDQMLEPES